MIKPETNFLREILTAIEALKQDDLPAPDWDIEADGYAVLGVLEDLDLRAMLALRKRFTEDCNAVALEGAEYMVQIMRQRPTAGEIAQKQIELKHAGDFAGARKKALDHFFWATLTMLHPDAADKPSVAIGKDWKIGWKKTEDRSGAVLMEILGSL